MKHPIPAAAIAQHMAILGKTGSGKTITAKGVVEKILSDDPSARVCVLDPIKSDWWGLISNTSGSGPGLPFYILGGPRGHVPLHDTAGTAIGELVASGALPLSIIDMADFGPGGLQAFFNDFAPALLRNMRGVIHLVWEEAHEFAPKERAGHEGENMTLYHAKKIATAGRSKGIRLIVATQATQLLHNRVLGSCETMVVQRLTAPADQKPVKDWLKANMDKATFETVANSLASLKTGAGWLCSGELQLAELVTFPALQTYDNSRTPAASDRAQSVKTAAVDEAKLRAIIGTAVKEAEANDVPALQKRIKELEKAAKDDGVTEADVQGAHDEGYRKGERSGAQFGYGAGFKDGVAAVVNAAREVAVPQAMPTMPIGITHRQGPFQAQESGHDEGGQSNTRRTPEPLTPRPRPQRAEGDGGMSKGDRKVLTVLAQRCPEPVTQKRAAIVAGYSPKKSTWRGLLAKLRQQSFIAGSGDLTITDAGLNALGSFDKLPTGRALLDHWRERLPKGQAQVLAILFALDGQGSASDVAQRAAYTPTSSTWRAVLAGLRSVGLIEGSRVLKLHEDLR